MKHPPRTFARLSPLAILILILLAAIARGAPPNVVLFLVDDLGYGDLSSYGHPTIKTPNIDGIGERGIRLTSYYAAAPSCSPSRAALLTGRYPLRVGLPRVLGPETTLGIPAAELTLAEALKEKGYRTAAIGKWHVGHAKPEFLPTGQGFDSYFGLLYSNDMIRPWVNTDRPLELWRNDRPIEHPVDQTQLTVRYTEEAQKFIRSSEGNPFFLYLPYSMVHVPIHAAPQFRDKSRAGPYGDVVEAIDWSVGQVLKTLHEVGVVDNTLVVFTSDNGPWQNMPDRMFQGNVIKPWHAGSAGPLRGYKATTYEGGVRVPAIIQWPSRIEGGRASADIVTAMDLYVTILKAAGAAVPSDRPVDGNDLTRFLKGEEPSPTKHYFYFNHERLEGVREGRWKLRWTREDSTGTPLIELFDLEIDPGEMYDRKAEFPEVVSRLREKMKQFAAELGATVASDR